jgi:hypothetical protein
MVMVTLKRLLAHEWLSIFLMMTCLSFGMFFSTAPFALPDEIIHAQTAWGKTQSSPTTLLQLTNSPISIPESLVNKKIWCFQQNSQSDSGCYFSAVIPNSKIITTEYGNINYPPIYYYIVGLGERIGDLVSGFSVLIVGRLFSLVLNLSLIFIVFFRAKSRNSLSLWAMPAVFFPMSYFLMAGINPNGFEITSLLLYTYFLRFEYIDKLSEKLATKSDSILLIFLGLLACSARPITFVWLAIVTLFAYLDFSLHSGFNIKSFVRIGLISAPGIVLGLLWKLKAVVETLPTVVQLDTLADIIRLAVHILSMLPVRTKEMFGVLGWLDTRAPLVVYQIIFVLLVIVIWKILQTKNRKSLLLWGIFILITALVPTIIEIPQWTYWPGFWQGRYTLPMFSSLLLILLGEVRGVDFKLVKILGLICMISSASFVYLNFLRYAYGLSADGFPIRFGSNPGLPFSWILATSLFLILFFLLILHRLSKNRDALGTRDNLLTKKRTSID